MQASASLYRRHRPRTFADVVGQDHVVRTLRNAIAQDKVHHAYLFVGSRGTGKTSMAKILAASLNCQGEAGGGRGAEGLADAGLEAVEHRDEVQRALATLSPEEREAIALRFGAELSVPEIAKVLGEPLTTVEGRVYRALRKLRDRLPGD